MSSGIRQLGPYRLTNLVYSGATTQLWKAVHDATGVTYALKMLVHRAAKDRSQIAYLKREYEFRRRVLDDNLINILEYRVEQGTPFLVIEWCPWPNMKSWIQEGLDCYRPIIRQMIFGATEAVAAMHRQKYVHRDIKPDNFLVSPQGQVKLIDFALAKKTGGLFSRFFGGAPKIQGTASYISPEQIRKKPLDGRADLYSLACTFFELTTGRPPFTGSSQSELLTKHLKAPPPSAETVNPEVSPQFSQLLIKALAKNPNDRFRSVPEFFGELHSVPIFKNDPTPAPAAVF